MTERNDLMLHRMCTNLVLAVFLALMLGNVAVVSAQSSQTSPAPNLSLSANSRTSSQSYQGWALILDATLFHPQIFSRSVQITPLLINAQNGSWANTIQLVVTDNNGVTQNWPMHLTTPPSGSLTLDVSSYGRLLWTMGPSDTSTILPGTYRVSALLNTTASVGTAGWNGVANSNSVSVQISPPPAAPTIAQQEQQAELLARYDHMLGNDLQAIADISAFLNLQPNDIGALALEGNLLSQTAQTANALAAYDQAVTAFYAANPEPLPEPPDGLLIPQARLRSQLLSQYGGRGTPQVAIRLFDQGGQSPGVFFVDLQITNVGNDVAENVLLNQLTFQTVSGAGQVMFNNVLSPPFPIFTDFLAVNGSATVRIFVTAQGTVNGFSMTENGTAADIFGTPSSFSQAQTVSLNFSGNLGPLTITANNATQQYGQPTPFLNNVTYNGFVNGDTAASLGGTLNCTTTATQSSPVGTYAITCSGQSSPSYTITYVSGVLTIIPAPLTVIANNASRLYGQSNPPLTVSYGGFVNGDTLASLSGVLSCTTTATQSSPLGIYPITCSGLSSPNYTITFARGTLTITPDSLTVTANNTSRQYAQSNPPFTVSYSGFVNGDTASALTGTLSCSTTATASSPAGTYPISCSGLSSTNYTITYVPGQLTITPPPCASNVTASVAVIRSGFSYSPLSKRYAQTLTLTNTAGSTITGPIYVILDNLTTSAALYNTGGSTACAAPTGSPYVSIAGPIGAGASTNVVLQFTDPTNAAISYTPRFLAGTGQP